MKILVTGGAGFIGTRMVSELVSHGFIVTVLDNLNPQVHGPNADFSSELKNISKCIKGDVRDYSVVCKSIKDVNYIIHLAAETGMGQSQYEIGRYFSTNVLGTSILLEAVTHSKERPQRIILSSSGRIYGEGPYCCPDHGRVFPPTRSKEQMQKSDWEIYCPKCKQLVESLPCKETDFPMPGSMYATTKLTQEQMIHLFGKLYGIETIVLRYQNVYGSGQSLRNPYTGILSVFCTRLRNGLESEVFEDGLSSRDFVHIDDIVQATIKTIEANAVSGETFNVGSGKAISILKVAEMIHKEFDFRHSPVINGAYRLGDIRHMTADISKARILLNYRPEVPFGAGIKNLVRWALSQPLYEDLSGKALSELNHRHLA